MRKNVIFFDSRGSNCPLKRFLIPCLFSILAQNIKDFATTSNKEGV